MKQFVALSLLMGIVRKPEIAHYWSRNPLLKGSTVSSTVSCLETDFRAFFCTLQTTASLIPMILIVIGYTKSGLLLSTYLVNKFRTVYVPEDHISIHEELLLWKGNLAFKQYIPMKRARFGIKLFSLCETSGY